MKLLPAAGALVVAGALGWVTYETVHAGSNIPPPSQGQATRLSGGIVSGKRLDGKSWSLDYGTAVMTADGSSAQIDDVHDGILYRNGSPYMRMRAKHVNANVALNQFDVTGPVSFTEIGGQHKRLQTIGASYAGVTQLLTLHNRTVVHDGAITLTVDGATINFHTGEMIMGRVVGAM